MTPLASGARHCPRTQTSGGMQVAGCDPLPPVLMEQFDPLVRQAAHRWVPGSQDVPKGVHTVEPVADGAQAPPTPWIA